MISALTFLSFSVTAIIIFWKFPLTFFQQDEWAIIGNFLFWQKADLKWWTRLFIYEQDTHILPLANLISYLQFYLFGINFIPYAIFAVTLHVVNAFLVYILASLLIKNKKIAFFSGLLFLVNSITHQAITWVATTIGTAGSTFFILLSLIFFVRFLDGSNKFKKILISSLFLLISLLFKEISLFVFLFIPILWIIYEKKRNLSQAFNIFWPYALLAFVYVCFRIYFVLFGYQSTSLPEEISQPGLLAYGFRIVSLPLKFISQSFIPQKTIISIGEMIIRLGYPQFVINGAADPYLVQSVASDIVTYYTAFIIIAISFILFIQKLSKEIKFRKIILVALVFIALSSLPFIFIPGKAGYFSLIDGRHLYLTSVFTSMLLAMIIYIFYVMFDKRRLVKYSIIFLTFGFLGINGLQIRRDLNNQIAFSYLRKLIINKIYNSYPVPPAKVIFYIESDKAFYGLPVGENIVPFQSGFGQTLLINYDLRNEKFPPCFFTGKYLYVLLSEDYKECEGRGFGYFRKLDNLKNSILQNKLQAENVIAFRFYSQENKLEDITKEVRSSL